MAVSEVEEDLLNRLRSGDESVLAALFEHYHERLWRMVHFRIDRRVAARIDPDDVLQESFLNATQRLPHYLLDTSRSFFVWLRIVVTQTLVDIHRRHAGTDKRDVRREVAFEGGATPYSASAALASELAESITSPSSAVARDELADRLTQAIATMDPLDQEIILLRHFEDLSNSEVAEVLGIRPTAASNRYVRAMGRMKELLDKMGWKLDE